MTINHGFPPAQWAAAKQEATILLWEKYARRQSLVWYSKFAPEIHAIHFTPHDIRLFQLLGEISTESNEAGNGMLSSLVVNKDDLRPGPGFFELAHELGHAFSDHDKFWLEQVRRVYNAARRDRS